MPSITLPEPVQLGLHTPYLEGTFSSLQALVLYAGIGCGLELLARGIVPWRPTVGSLVAVALAIVLAGSITGSSSMTGVWYGIDGRSLPNGLGQSAQAQLVMSVEQGPVHCGWGSVLFLDLAWPPGRVVSLPLHKGDQELGYVRDPAGRYPTKGLATSFDGSVSLPAVAGYTGFHRGTWQLWVIPSERNVAVWMKSGDTVERWPFNISPFGCA